MSTRRWMDRICVAALILALLLTAVMMNGESLGLQEASRTMGYESRLFDTSRVHTIHIVMDDWDDFIAECENEEYAPCSVVIDGESYTNVGLRAKGNTSLSSVSAMGSDRYSFKLEFDQYDSTKSYYGLDKLSLNNLIQDTTMMKDYLTYRMMDEFGVAAPLCSYVYITVNGEDWGLYLAVEAVEDAFLRRNYGANYGDLYKPDSLSMGGGRGNGREFDMGEFDFSQFSADFDASAADEKTAGQSEAKWNRGEQSGGSDGSGGSGSRPSMGGNTAGGMFNMGEMGGSGGSGSRPSMGGNAAGGMFNMGEMGGSGGSGSRPSMDGNAAGGMFNMGDMGGFGGFGGFGMGSSDVKLQYIDDDPDSYPNIFSSAKTEVTAADQNRLIAALKTLSGGTDVERAVAVEDEA